MNLRLFPLDRPEALRYLDEGERRRDSFCVPFLTLVEELPIGSDLKRTSPDPPSRAVFADRKHLPGADRHGLAPIPQAERPVRNDRLYPETGSGNSCGNPAFVKRHLTLYKGMNRDYSNRTTV